MKKFKKVELKDNHLEHKLKMKENYMKAFQYIHQKKVDLEKLIAQTQKKKRNLTNIETFMNIYAKMNKIETLLSV